MLHMPSHQQRYLVVVWNFGSWDVALATDFRDEAIKARNDIATDGRAVFVDTRPDDDPIGPDDAPAWMNADEARGYYSGWVQAILVVLGREI